MVSTKSFTSLDGSVRTFLSDVTIKSEQYCRVYNYMYDPNGVDGELQANGLYNRTVNTPQAEDQTSLEDWLLVNNNVSFYTAPPTGSTLIIEVATTPEELGDVLAGTAVQQAEDARDLAEQYRDEAAVSAAATAADVVTTNADVVSTNADVVLTNADVVSTNADAAQTALDKIATNADVVSTNADAAQTSLDKIATAADVVTTNANVLLTNADVVTTNANVLLTNADVVSTNADVVLANKWAEELEDVEVTVGTYSALHHAAKAAQSAAEAATFDPSSYYTKTNLDTGQLDTRYYTETEVDTALGLKLNSTNPSITGSITEETAVATDVLEPDNGTIQYRTLVANTTFTDGLAEGQTLTLYLTNGGFLPTYPTITWDNATEPTLGTTDRLYFEKVNGVLYGFHTATFV